MDDIERGLDCDARDPPFLLRRYDRNETKYNLRRV